jgi:hypothetical protein
MYNQLLFSSKSITSLFFALPFTLFPQLTLPQMPISYQLQAQSTSIVKIYFPDESQVKLINNSSMTGRITKLSVDGISLHNSNRIIPVKSINEIVFLRQGHVRGVKLPPLYNGNRDRISWRVALDKLWLKDVDNVIGAVDLAGALAPQRVENITNTLSNKKAIRISKLVYQANKTIIIEGVILPIENLYEK